MGCNGKRIKRRFDTAEMADSIGLNACWDAMDVFLGDQPLYQKAEKRPFTVSAVAGVSAQGAGDQSALAVEWRLVAGDVAKQGRGCEMTGWKKFQNVVLRSSSLID
jgi:hypothetical protein